MTETRFIPGPDTARAFRDALGCFATGVTVVTTATATGPMAITASSFTSVSLDPALVLWCAAKHSLRHDSFATARRYAIHVIGEKQQPLAAHFARTGNDFSAIDWVPDAEGVPILSGCLARFDCLAEACHPGGDHSILVGRVLHAMHRPGQGLIYKRGQFGGFFGLD
ncbi:flavin reductase family protein [Antarcticimicrobium sediminis]|uniref:Flavin reductase n=1 Tax=Antarcticimicrobium sediminis TaxID=2546227 RepID=A0A4R5F0F4_9RHOB|nr:flavin reductase family protein [Antarcticimicrobium sediminis]TDE40861.1 flavin reductase [Antarcticimicrobium sediminis]